VRARILAAFVLMAAFVLALVELPFGFTYAARQQDRLLADIERDARVLASLVEERVERGDVASVTTTLREYEGRTGGRVVVTDSTGRSVVDSEPDVPLGRDYSTRPEIAAALSGTQLSGIRSSDTLGGDLAYVAVPIASGGDLGGTIRVTFPTERLEQQVRANWFRLGLLTVFVLAAAAALGWLVASWVLRPIRQLQAATDELARGDLDARLDLHGGPPELVELATRFDTMAERLAALITSRDAFVADASHQLRTPLTALRLRLDVLEDVVGDDGEATRELDALTGEVDRLSSLVEALLELARSTGGDDQLVPVDLEIAVDALAERWAALAAERGILVEVHAGGTPGPGGGTLVVGAVDGAVDQVLDNLVDNALDVAPTGSTISVSARSPSAETAVLEVRDHGPGLDEASRARALDRFWRAPDAPSGGSGLGLSIVAELVRRSHGSIILLDPDDGDGLLVRVSLPRWSTVGSAS